MRIIVFLTFFLCAVLAMADAVIFSGNDVKALKYNLDLFGRSKVMGLNVDPSAGAGVDAPPGSIGMNYLTGDVYFKQTTSATGWKSLSGIYQDQLANTVFAGPSSGVSGPAAFRALVNADLPFPLIAPAGNVSNPQYRFADTDSGMWQKGDGNITFSANGFERLSIDQNNVQVTSNMGVSGDLTVGGNITAANFPPVGNSFQFAAYDISGALDNAPDVNYDISVNRKSINVVPSTTVSQDSYDAVSLTGNMTEEVNGQSGFTANRQQDGVTGGYQAFRAGDLFAGTASVGNSYAFIDNTNFQAGSSLGGHTSLYASPHVDTNSSGSRGVQIAHQFGPGAAMSMDNWITFQDSTNVKSGSYMGSYNALSLGPNFEPGSTGGTIGILYANPTVDRNAQSMAMLGTNGTYGTLAPTKFDFYSDINVNPNFGANFEAGFYNAMLLRPNITAGAQVSQDVTMINIGLNSALPVSGSATGIYVDMANFDSPQIKRGLSINQGAIESGVTVDSSVLSVGPGAYTGNVIGGTLRVGPANSISNSFGFGNNLGFQLVMDGDMLADNFLGTESLGFSLNGFVNQIAGTDGYQWDTVNYMAAGGSPANPATQISMNHVAMFRALGIQNSGSAMGISHAYGFQVGDSFNFTSALEKWGFYNSSDSDNWFKNNVVIGANSLHPQNASVALEISSSDKAALLSRLTNAEEAALTALNGMMIYNTDLAKFRCYQAGAWADCGSGSGGITFNAVGSSPNASAASVSGSAITLQPYSINFPGVMTTGAQAVSGDKSFAGRMLVGSAGSVSADSAFEVSGTNLGSRPFPRTATTNITPQTEGVFTYIPGQGPAYYDGTQWIQMNSVSQASMIAAMTQAGASGCSYAENSSSGLSTYVDLGVGTGCNAWTAEGIATAVGTNDHRITLTNMPPGDYMFVVNGAMQSDTSAQECSFRFSDSTNTFGNAGLLGGAASVVAGNLVGRFSYTAAGTRTFKIQASDTGIGNCIWTNAAAGLTVSWAVYKYPLASQQAITPANQKAPTVTRLTSGTAATYTPPTGAVMLKIKMVGGGGGGSGSGTSAGTAATNGTASTFGTSLLTAGGGGLGNYNGAGGAGAANTINSPAVSIVSALGGGGGGSGYVESGGGGRGGGSGGNSFFGGGAQGTEYNSAGVAGLANTGGGGSGGGAENVGANNVVGSGGGAGSYVEAIITNPSASYLYTVGPGGSAGGAGSGGSAGGAGASGIIIIEEFYSYGNLPLFVGQVSSSASGKEVVNRVSVTSTCTSSPCAITSQSGSWTTSITRASTGMYTINYTGFSAPPACFANARQGGTNFVWCAVYGNSSSSATIQCQDSTAAGTVRDTNFDIFCMAQ